MDLTRGICILCTNNTTISIPPQAKETTSLLKEVLADQIDYEKFDDVNSLFKVCPLCLHDLVTLADLKQNIKKEYSKDYDNCLLCYAKKHLVRITDWAHFDKTLQCISTDRRPSKCFTCLNCIKYLDLMDRIKSNIFKKYPDLKISDSKKDELLRKVLQTRKNSHETYRKVKHSSKCSSDEEPEYLSQRAVKDVNNLKSALKHLKPLKNSQFNIDRYKKDKKLLRQIAFVKLSVSNLSTQNFKKIKGRSERSNRSISPSDSDSSRDSPSSKQSFFKIRLKLNHNKIRSQRVTHGKVTKPKIQKNKPVPEIKKELMINIIKMNFDKINDSDQEFEDVNEIRTPTKASRKMMPEDSGSSSRKRKSVTFAEVLDTEITDSRDPTDNVDSTPLKSLLKKSVSHKSDPLKKANESSSDESDNEKNKTRKREELNSDLDEEEEAVKSYVDEILKNNDSIFDNLKTSENTEVKSQRSKKNRRSYSIDSNTSDSDDDGKNTKSNKNSEDNKKKSLRKRIISTTKQVDSSDSENDENRSDSPIGENKHENKEKSAEYKKKKRRNTISSNDFDDNEKHESESERTNSDAKNCHGDVAEVVEEENKLNRSSNTENDTNDSTSKLNKKNDKTKNAHEKHNKRKGSNSSSGSDDEESTTKNGGNSTDLFENKDHETKLSSATNGGIARFNVDPNTDKSDSTSFDDQEVTLEELKKLRKSDTGRDAEPEEIVDKNHKELEDSGSETTITDKLEITSDTENIDEDSESKSEDVVKRKLNESNQTDENIDNNFSNKEKENKSNLADDKNSSDIESDTGNNSESKSKSKKRRRSTGEGQEEDEGSLKICRNEDCEEPETKREKVSEVDEMSKPDSETDIKASDTKNKDLSLKVPEEQKDVGSVDNKIDKIIAKYANPSIPNNDNNVVSDSQNAGASGEDQGSRSDAFSKESEETEDIGPNINEVRKSTKHLGGTVTLTDKENGESDY